MEYLFSVSCAVVMNLWPIDESVLYCFIGYGVIEKLWSTVAIALISSLSKSTQKLNMIIVTHRTSIALYISAFGCVV